MLAACLVQVSLLPIGQQGLGHFFSYLSLLLIGWSIVQILHQLLVQYKQQANPLLSMHNYTPLFISRNDKNRQLTLSIQRKLALTTRNTLFVI
jgi:hypothetical protein